MFLMDTNICIYFMKDLYPHLTKKLLLYNPCDLLISSITLYELEYGASKSSWSEKARHKMAMFLAPFNILPLTADDAISAGRVRAYLEQIGRPIEPCDLLIAAQALSRDIAVITHNTVEFNQVPKLKLEDWVI